MDQRTVGGTVIFKRKNDPGPSASEADATLPPLTVNQAARLRQLVLASLAERGLEGVTASGDTLNVDGGQVGLYNLAVSTAQQPESAWPDVVAHFLDTLLPDMTGASGRTIAAPTDVYIKLHEAADLPHTPAYPLLEPLPGIVGVLAVDRPDTVAELLGANLDEVGGDAPTAYRNALANVAALPLPEVVGSDRTGFTTNSPVLAADDFFGPSRILALPALLSRTLGAKIPPAGVLVAIPDRATLAVHLMQDGTALNAVVELANFALWGYEKRPGPVSPGVFHLTPEMEGARVTSLSDDGKLDIRMTGRVAEAFNALGFSF